MNMTENQGVDSTPDLGDYMKEVSDKLNGRLGVRYGEVLRALDPDRAAIAMNCRVGLPSGRFVEQFVSKHGLSELEPGQIRNLCETLGSVNSAMRTLTGLSYVEFAEGFDPQYKQLLDVMGWGALDYRASMKFAFEAVEASPLLLVGDVHNAADRNRWIVALVEYARSSQLDNIINSDGSVTLELEEGPVVLKAVAGDDGVAVEALTPDGDPLSRGADIGVAVAAAVEMLASDNRNGLKVSV